VGLWVAGFVLLASCGTATNELKLPGPDAPSTPLSKQQYTVQFNEVCRAMTKEIVERVEKTGSGNLDGSGGGDRQKLHDAVDPVTTLGLAHLRNLTPPPENTDVARRAVGALQASVDAAANDPTIPLDPVGTNQPELFDFGLTGCFTKQT
jgi:hypothetical protein